MAPRLLSHCATRLSHWCNKTIALMHCRTDALLHCYCQNNCRSPMAPRLLSHWCTDYCRTVRQDYRTVRQDYRTDAKSHWCFVALLLPKQLQEPNGSKIRGPWFAPTFDFHLASLFYLHHLYKKGTSQYLRFLSISEVVTPYTHFLYSKILKNTLNTCFTIQKVSTGRNHFWNR